MGTKIEDVFPIEDDMERIPASCVNLPEGTLPGITIELENGSLQDDGFLYNGVIFHFHDYGGKGNTWVFHQK